MVLDRGGGKKEEEEMRVEKVFGLEKTATSSPHLPLSFEKWYFD